MKGGKSKTKKHFSSEAYVSSFLAASGVKAVLTGATGEFGSALQLCFTFTETVVTLWDPNPHEKGMDGVSPKGHVCAAA